VVSLAVKLLGLATLTTAGLAASVSVPEAKAVPRPGDEHAANSASFIGDNFGISKELADRLPGEGIGIAVPAPQNRLILIQLTDGSRQYPHIAEGVAGILS
jgi:hypothetical protein